jgi:hypothetical protein
VNVHAATGGGVVVAGAVPDEHAATSSAAAATVGRREARERIGDVGGKVQTGVEAAAPTPVAGWITSSGSV